MQQQKNVMERLIVMKYMQAIDAQMIVAQQPCQTLFHRVKISLLRA
ncbi:hypothetical protein [Solemya elarraichensis gill symbiont]|nr:hypothetical protein [Solemya elarraichensis gill symbiont]